MLLNMVSPLNTSNFQKNNFEMLFYDKLLDEKTDY